MERTRPSTSSIADDSMVDTSPLLGNSTPSPQRSPGNLRGGLSGAARFLRQASNRRMMREPSMMVREAAAEQLEERQSDWAYSKPVVILDLIWNLAFVMVAAVIIGLSKNELPSTPLRLWVCGYCLQCVLHMVCVCVEYRRRHQQYQQRQQRSNIAHGVSTYGNLGPGSELDGDQSSEDGDSPAGSNSYAKRLESANTMFSFVWWIVGFYWITVGGQALVQEAPRLYWLCVVFLAFDVLFVVFCVALACVIGIAVCCCLPCIIAILYAVADQEGASDEDISALLKFKFRRTGSFDKTLGDKSSPSRGVMSLMGAPADGAKDRFLSAENAECCICLSAYEDGVELRELPCGHHFHCTCIDKWLRINATCPLCKFNIIKSNNLNRDDSV
ncbi:hypothetical protein GOP47_0018300 [Adiantum capillus-veneris]|uniref:RING-type E3 ubiquitin transferase n=1 Tax=Adiantum capillus-veneris TaxID=13818 RepID=A0A9D4UHH9_ADICA|nr:hypothetical protein GOP47_0017859 [Adiantum capillus-veneris]KAI5067772.1 hypothetical protein GOP47_0018300 [Adiantum capillus-veneris]